MMQWCIILMGLLSNSQIATHTNTLTVKLMIDLQSVHAHWEFTQRGYLHKSSQYHVTPWSSGASNEGVRLLLDLTFLRMNDEDQ